MHLPNPIPQPRPEVVPPRPAVQPPPGKRRGLRIGIPVALLIAGGIAWQMLQDTGGTGGAVTVVTPTVAVETGKVESVLRLNGKSSSTRYVNVTTPRMQRRGFQLTLIDMVESGAIVQPGQIVARLDTQSLADRLDDIEANVDTSESDLAKVRANQALDRSNTRQDLDVVKAELERWKIEARASEIRTPVDQEIIKLALEEADQTYKEKLAEAKLRETVLQSSYKISVLNGEQNRRDLDRYTADLERHNVKASMAGMAVRQEVSRDQNDMAPVKIGDTLRPGMIFLKIMDLSTMQIEAQVNQTESRLLRSGQDVRIGLDAYSDVTLSGTITSIGALAQAPTGRSDYVRTIPVKIRIIGSHPKLIPDLTAHADVILSSGEGLRVPLEAVHEEAGQAYVYVKTAKGFQKRPVTLGQRNFTHVTVTSGLQQGEQVATQPPAAAI